MNTEMAYLLGMICGNGEIQRGPISTIIAIEIPHKKQLTEMNQDVKVYVEASIINIREIIDPLLGTALSHIQNDNVTTLSFVQQNEHYVMREILRFVGAGTSHENMRLHDDVFHFTKEEKIYFLRGFADVTGYIRKSNYFYQPYAHRVYLEIPHNWYLVIDICNLLKSLDIPVQDIDWAHPNMRDGNLIKYNAGNRNFWKKEHQIKIFANEFNPIGFGVIHKNKALKELSRELVDGFRQNKINIATTHRFYWEVQRKPKPRPVHPGEVDIFIPQRIRGRHYESWKQIAHDLGYGE